MITLTELPTKSFNLGENFENVKNKTVHDHLTFIQIPSFQTHFLSLSSKTLFVFPSFYYVIVSLSFALSLSLSLSLHLPNFVSCLTLRFDSKDRTHRFFELNNNRKTAQDFCSVSPSLSRALILSTRTLFHVALSFTLKINRPPSSFQRNPHPLSCSSLFQQKIWNKSHFHLKYTNFKGAMS